MKSVESNKWTDFAWPAWVPPEIRQQIEGFWSNRDHRGPNEWMRDNQIQRTPEFGEELRVKIDKHGWAEIHTEVQEGGQQGRYVHCWNNIGRLIAPDGKVVYAAGSKAGAWVSGRGRV